VVRAASECIAELGYSNATMTEIARRAGVTWGAMQHQFGDKEAIIDAVIEWSLEEFARQMQGLRQGEPEIESRVHAFAQRAWVVFRGPVYRVILGILLQHREKTERIAEVMNGVWEDCFGDLNLPEEQQFAAQRFTFVLLAGIATESVVVPWAGDARDHFVVLERTLLEMLRGKPAAGTDGERSGT
jgi:AcrR family transcriptional regulator